MPVLIHVGRRSWLFLIASGLATGLSWICYFRALSMGEASKVAPIDKLSVVFVVLLAWPLLGETITLAKAAGVLVDRCRGDCSGVGLTDLRAFRNLFEPLDNGSRISCEPGELNVADRLCAAKREAHNLG